MNGLLLILINPSFFLYLSFFTLEPVHLNTRNYALGLLVRRRSLSANARDLDYYERNWHHWEEHRPRPPTINNNINIDLYTPTPCPECNGNTKYESDRDETVCTKCGLIVSTSHRYVRGERIYIPFLDDRPPEEPFDHILWWTQFLIDFKPFIYPDDRRYYDPKQASNRS